MQPTSNNNFFGVKVSKAGIPVQNASEKQLVYKDDFSTKTYYDNSNPRMIEGLLPDGTYGMWVSKPGLDVSNPNAPSNNALVFNSNQDIFKIVESATVTIPQQVLGANSSYFDTIQIPHNLLFIPILQSYGQVQYNIVFNNTLPAILVNAYIALPYDMATAGVLYGNISRLSISAGVDSNNIYFAYEYSTSSGGGQTFPPVPIRYYLLQETAN